MIMVTWGSPLLRNPPFFGAQSVTFWFSQKWLARKSLNNNGGLVRWGNPLEKMDLFQWADDWRVHQLRIAGLNEWLDSNGWMDDLWITSKMHIQVHQTSGIPWNSGKQSQFASESGHRSKFYPLNMLIVLHFFKYVYKRLCFDGEFLTNDPWSSLVIQFSMPKKEG